METYKELNLILLLEDFFIALKPHFKLLNINVVVRNFKNKTPIKKEPFSILIDLNIFLQQILLTNHFESNVTLIFSIEEKSNDRLQLICSINGLNNKSLKEINIEIEKKLTAGYLDITKSTFYYTIQTTENKINNSFFPIHHHGIPPYYAEIKKRLKSHFSSISSLEEFADKKSMEHGTFLKSVHRIIDKNLENEAFKVEQLYVALGLSRTQLYRKLKPLTKMSPAKYLIYYRLQKAKSLLQETTYNVSQVVSMVGFSSHSYFTRAFCEQFGMNPSIISKSASSV